MAMRREELDLILREAVGSGCAVYFQPPDNKRITYPCLMYELAGFHHRHADNLSYSRIPKWELIYITRDPDDPNIEKLAGLPQCSMGRPYVSDNLYHNPYTIYY